MRQAVSDFDPSVFPVIYGNELETSIALRRSTLQYDELFPGDERFANIKTTYETPRNIHAFIPKEFVVRHDLSWLTNGFRAYDGNASGSVWPPKDHRIELATPECATISDLAIYTRVAERILEIGSRALLERNPNSEIDGIRIQKRVVDSVGNTWGCHDNYGYDKRVLKEFEETLGRYVGMFAASRVLIVGAGHYTEDGYEFSQKLGDVKKDKAYGSYGRHYRIAPYISDEDKAARIEVSSSDPNISDWATKIRVGSMALLFAAVFTDKVKGFQNFFDDESYSRNVEAYGAERNGLHYNQEKGTIELNRQQTRSLATQRAVAETFLGDVVDLVGAPRELKHIAEEIIRFCDDLQAVSRGQSSITCLADRSDWAARVLSIEGKVQKANPGTPEEEMMVRKTADVNYDGVFLQRTPEGEVITDYGYGYRLRGRNKFLGAIPENTIEKHLSMPPNTRAAARAALLESGYEVASANWSRVTLRLPGGEHALVPLYDPISAHVPSF